VAVYGLPGGFPEIKGRGRITCGNLPEERAQVSQWKLTQINSTGGKRPYVRRSHLSGFPRGEVPFPLGARGS